MNKQNIINKKPFWFLSKRNDTIKRYTITYLVFLLIIPNLYSQNYYVSPNASGTGNGTIGNPWTIYQAASSAVGGDTVIIKIGQYNITNKLDFNNNGTSVYPIVFIGEYINGYYPWTATGDSTAYLYCTQTVNGTINFNGNYVEIHNVVMVQAPTLGTQLINVGGDYVTIDNCVVKYLKLSSGDHTTVVKPSAQHFTLKNSFMYYGGRTVIWGESSNTGSCDNILIDGNVFKHNSNHNAIQIMPLTDTNPGYQINGTIIRNNLFDNCSYSHNILLRHNNNSQIYNNVFHNSGYIKLESHNYGTDTTGNILISNNTWVEDDAIYPLYNQAMNRINWKNNLVMCETTLDANYIYRFWTATPTYPINIGHSFDYNHYYVAGDPDFSSSIIPYYVGSATTTTNISWANWKSSYGHDNHTNVNVRPTFMNESAADFRPLSSNSPQVGAGTPIPEITMDKNGNPRDPNNPTIGAFEFSNGSIDITPPNLLGAVLNNSTTLTLNFSEPLNPTTAQNINNYFVNNGINIISASLSGSQVTLTTTEHSSGNYVVTVSNVTDLAGNVINPNNNTATYDYSTIDVTPPQVVSAAILDSVTLQIYFSENLDPTGTQNINNYSINSISITNATLNANVVTLITSEHSPGAYSVLVSNVTDLAGNVIDPQYNSAIYEYQAGSGTDLLMFPVSSVLASVSPEPNHTGDKTIDGKGFYQNDPDSRWAGDTMPEWLVYDLGDVQILNITKLSFYKWNEGRTYNYSVQVSTDSINWTTLRSEVVSTINQEWSEEVVGPIDARYIKIIFINSNQNSWAGLWESEFRGHLKMPTNQEDEKITPTSFVLEQNYPNPFNPSTKIKVIIPQTTQMRLAVYNLLGELISEVANGMFNTGAHEFDFVATGLASGIYIYRIESPDFFETKKMVLMR